MHFSVHTVCLQFLQSLWCPFVKEHNVMMPAIASILIFFIIILFDDKFYSKKYDRIKYQEASTFYHDRNREANF